MSACHYCGEEIKNDARLCKHCQRPNLFTVSLQGQLNDKQKLAFFKVWQKLEKNDFRHVPLQNYKHAKEVLETPELIVGWDLTHKQANEILAAMQLPDALVLKFQGGLPSTFDEMRARTHVEKRASYVSYLYAFIGLCFIGAAVGLGWKMQPTHPTSKEDEVTGGHQIEIKLPDDSISPIPDIPSFSQTPNDATRSRPLEDRAPAHGDLSRTEMNKLLNSTVFITDGQKLGSGFFISESGYIFTNAHVSSSMETPIVILRDGRQFQARKIQDDTHIDLALLKIDGGTFPALKIGDASQLYAGQPIITIGNPGGLSFTVTRGVVSYVGRVMKGVPYIQTDAAINRGNSGGPMINENLEVVGINSLTSLNEQGISFALPINLGCQNGSMGATIGINCTSFHGDDEPEVSPAALNPRDSKSNNSRYDYQRDADELKAKMQRELSELDTEESNVKNDVAAWTAELAQHKLDGSLKERLNPKVKAGESSLKVLEKKRVESQVRYARQVRDLLLRQKADPDFVGIAPQIDGEIAQLEASLKSFDDFLSKN